MLLGMVFKDHRLKEGLYQTYDLIKKMSFAGKTTATIAVLTLTYKVLDSLQLGQTRATETTQKAFSEFENANSELESTNKWIVK